MKTVQEAVIDDLASLKVKSRLKIYEIKHITGIGVQTLRTLFNKGEGQIKNYNLVKQTLLKAIEEREG